MNGYNFTERVRKVLAMAHEESVRLHHEYVGTEHILLGVMREGEGVAAAVLRNLQVDLDALHDRILEHVKKGRETVTARAELPYTSRAKKVLELAMTEARELKHSYVGTEHLLLGLLREEKGVAAQVLTAAGADIQSVRHETLKLLGSPDASHGGKISLSDARQLRPREFTLRVNFQGNYWLEQRFPSANDAIAFLKSFPPPPGP